MKTITSRVLILVQLTAELMRRAHERIGKPHELIQTKDLLRRVLAKIKKGPKMMMDHSPSRMGVKTKKVVTKISNLK